MSRQPAPPQWLTGGSGTWALFSALVTHRSHQAVIFLGVREPKGGKRGCILSDGDPSLPVLSKLLRAHRASPHGRVRECAIPLLMQM